MKLRLLKTEVERTRFRAGMLQARAAKGGKFRETARSRVSEIQLTFARLYGIFDDADPNYLLGGFSIHCLNEFSQSFPIPNLSHLPPSVMYEAGQLWAASHEAAQAMRKGSMILLGLFQAQGLLIYPLIIPRDVSTLYRVFKRVGPPFELPFAETVTGDKVYMQAMLLEGDELRRQVELASRDGFETQSGHSIIRFDAPRSDVRNQSDRPPAQAFIDGSQTPVLARSAISISGSRRSGAPVFEPDTTSPSRIDGVAKEERPVGSSGRWSWCEYANEPRRCPLHDECELKCRAQSAFISGTSREKTS
jgi:hypothetical protein